MIAEASKRRINKIFKLDGRAYAFDSVIIYLIYKCLNVVYFANIKLHTLYDFEMKILALVHITPANIHESKAMPEIPYESGGITYSTMDITISATSIQ